jgi:hypothetical protein
MRYNIKLRIWIIFSLVIRKSGHGTLQPTGLKVHLSLYHLTYSEMLTSIEIRYGVVVFVHAIFLPGGRLTWRCRG